MGDGGHRRFIPADAGVGQPVGRTPMPQENAATQPLRNGMGGYGVDPKLATVYQPGAFWPLTLTTANIRP